MPARELAVAGVTLVAILALAVLLGDAFGSSGSGETVVIEAPTPAVLGIAATPTPTTPRTPTPGPAPAPTVEAGESIEQFLFMFKLALGRDDVDWIFDRIHPVALSAAGEVACRIYVDNEFVKTTSIELVSVATGPDTITKELAGEEVEVRGHYTAEVEVVFDGETFETVAEYALVDGHFRWFTPCS